ncbi:MAG: DegV family protein [Acidimicrobiia bacterium]
MGVRVVTDSACDLPEDLAEELAIEIVPLSIRFGDKEFVDRVELTNTEFWARMRDADTLPETAAPSAGAFEERFRMLADSGADAIVCINLASKLSATMQAAQIAAKSLEQVCPIAVIDSTTASMGIGTLAVSAARMAAENAPFDEIVREVTSQRDRTRIFAALDTLDSLRKGGRIGGAAAMLGSVLSIKPLIEIRDGVVLEAGKVRTRSKAWRELAGFATRQPVERLAVLQGGGVDIEELLAHLEAAVPRDQMIIGEIGPVIGTHGGPGVVGLSFQTVA